MFEVSKAEIIETLAIARKSNEFGKFENGKVILEDGDIFDVRSNAFGWIVKDIKNNIKAENIDLMDAINEVLDTVEIDEREKDAYEDFESGAIYYSQAN